MIKNLQISNFRGFRYLRAEELGRVNLLVGTNNSGKTSVLEAIELLASNGDPGTIIGSLERRSEIREPRSGTSDSRRTATIAHLFTGHRLDLGSEILIEGERRAGAEQSLRLTVEAQPEEDADVEQVDLFKDEEANDGPLRLRIRNSNTSAKSVPLVDGGIDIRYRRRWDLPSKEGSISPIFIPTTALSSREVKQLFDQTVLTPEEDLVIEALRSIEPTVQRLASVSSARTPYRSADRSGIVAKLENVDERIPIGSLGEGMWRLLSLALALVEAEGSTLLVDEIDTGFHFTVMERMWKLVYETAERLDVQVFATSHSSDCWMSLAGLAQSLGEEASVSIHRVEKNEKSTVVFTPQEMAVAAERGIEVR